VGENGGKHGAHNLKGEGRHRRVEETEGNMGEII
jgi:hypothetical protein